MNLTELTTTTTESSLCSTSCHSNKATVRSQHSQECHDPRRQCFLPLAAKKNYTYRKNLWSVGRARRRENPVSVSLAWLVLRDTVAGENPTLRMQQRQNCILSEDQHSFFVTLTFDLLA